MAKSPGRPCVEMVGKRFGRLVVMARAENKGKKARWICSCDCGRTSVAFGSDLRREHHRSCGCLQIETVLKHGATGAGRPPTAEYRSWQGLKDRCLNPKNPHYDRYGGRGITVCARWRDSFENFFADMGPRPTPKHTIERIEKDGDYTPDNCRWATRREQAQNRSITQKMLRASRRRMRNHLGQFS